MEHAKVNMIKLGVGYSTREKERRLELSPSSSTYNLTHFSDAVC